MSLRIDVVDQQPGCIEIGCTGLGVLAEAIPAGGQGGGAFLHDCLELPTDLGKEIRGVVTVWPAAGQLFVFEDGSFIFSGPDGVHEFSYDLYQDGAPQGSGTVRIVQGA